MARNGWLALALVVPLLGACTVIEVEGRRRPVGVEADGLIDGHLTFGISGETSPLRVGLFDGRSRGALFELVVWKLFRLEVGLAGFDIGVGPIDAGLGVLFFDPALPPQPPRRVESKKVEPLADGASEVEDSAPPVESTTPR